MTRDAIRFGMAVSLSGRHALQGRQCAEGLECYARDANGAGGIFLPEAGRRLRVDLTVYDDESSEERVRERTGKLIEGDAVDILIGPYGSNLTLAAAEIADQREVVLWNHSGSADAIFACNLSWVVGILTPASRYLSTVLEAIKAVDPALRRVALIHARTGFAADMSEGVVGWTEREGCSLVHDLPYSSGLPDFRPLLERVAAEPPDVLLGVGRLEDDLLLGRQIREVRPRVKAAGLVVAAISRFKAVLGKQADGFFAPSQWEPWVHYAADFGPSEEAFVQHYLKSATVAIDYPAAQGYAAGLIAQRCLEAAGTLDQAALRAAAGEVRCTTFFGPYAIDPTTGRQLAHPMLVTQWQQGKKVVVWPREVAEAESLYPGPLWTP